LAGGINVYAYVKNPIVWIDPLGLQARGPVLLGMGELYRADIQPPMPTLTRSPATEGLLNDITNLPFPSDHLSPGEWVGVNFNWQMPELYCAAGYYEIEGLPGASQTDNSGKTCKRQVEKLPQSFSVKGSDFRKFTCTQVRQK
jgi:uncharacterized protein RhaS with RHS repeats